MFLNSALFLQVLPVYGTQMSSVVFLTLEEAVSIESFPPALTSGSPQAEEL